MLVFIVYVDKSTILPAIKMPFIHNIETLSSVFTIRIFVGADTHPMVILIKDTKSGEKRWMTSHVSIICKIPTFCKIILSTSLWPSHTNTHSHTFLFYFLGVFFLIVGNVLLIFFSNS